MQLKRQGMMGEEESFNFHQGVWNTGVSYPGNFQVELTDL